MADPLPVGDVVTAVSDALRGDRAKLSAIVAGTQQRAEDRALDAIASGGNGPRVAPPLRAAVARPIPQPGPDRGVEIRLRNGRRVRAMISPAVARRADLSAIARAGADNDRRTFAALRRHRTAIRRLAQSHEELAQKVAALQNQAEQAVIGLVQGVAGLDRRVRDFAAQAPSLVTTASPSASDRGSLGELPQRQGLRQAGEVKALALRAQIQNVTNVVNSVQAAAYGQKGSILAPNNLRLAGNQLFWSVLDPLLQRAGLVNATTATVLAALAPLGTLLTGQLLLGDRQHVRFISGVATVDGTNAVVSESLRDEVAEGLWPEFQRRTDVPVTATLLDPAPVFAPITVFAEVVQGVLRITLQPVFGETGETGTFATIPARRFRVAWIVDTGADVG